MKANPGKCHAILSSNTQREIRFDSTSIASLSETLLGSGSIKFAIYLTKN